MRPANPDKPSFHLLMAIRSGQKEDSLYGQQLNLQAGRKHAYVASRNNAAARRGYDREWSLIRKRILREHPFCERCEKDFRMVESVLVHHRDHDASNRADGNLEALCRSCHEREHAGKGR